MSNLLKVQPPPSGISSTGAQPKALALFSIPYESGGAERDRTVDPLLAKQVLSQLSYSPIANSIADDVKVVGLGRFELPTSPLSGVRSNQLSYRPDGPGLPPRGIREPGPGISLIYSRKVSRTQLNMQSSYAAVTIVKRLRRREGLVQAHASSPKRTGMVLGNITLTQVVVRPELPAFAGRF